jgi:hypothetical protein
MGIEQLELTRWESPVVLHGGGCILRQTERLQGHHIYLVTILGQIF